MDGIAYVFLSKRHEWMVTKLVQAYGFTDQKTGQPDRKIAEKAVKDNKKKIDAFLLDPSSPPKLFFFFQPRQFKVPELFVSTLGDGEKLEGKCVYFLRTINKPVNVKQSQDNTVLSGEISSDILQTFEATLSQLYAPLLKQQEEWGQIKREKERKQFIDLLNKFDEDLRRKIANLKGDVELSTPKPPFDKIEQKPAAYAKAAKDPECLAHFQEIVTSWCEQITKYSEDDPSNVPLDKNNDTGPDVEIEYWSRRMLTLISITEQLKTKQNRVVTGVLKHRAARNDPEDQKDEKAMAEQEACRNLIERWKEVDLAITDALNEAKDNVRFLENLRKIVEPIFTESPTAIADTMPTLMNSVKMIHTLSRHYGTEVRMTNLFERITNQLITRCKEDIYAGEPVQNLWKQSPAEVITKMNACIKLFDSYRAHYKDTKAKLAQMSKGKQFNFDETCIFGKFTRFCRRLEKLIDMFSSIKQFKALESKRIDGMEPLLANFDQLINDFKVKNHDLLDFYNTVFERDFVEFTMKNSGLENAIQDFMESSLAQMSSIDKKLELLAKFQEVLSRDALLEDLDQKALMVFRLYGEDLHRLQLLFETYKNTPPVARNMTPIAGRIHWSRQLLRRITSPMKKFQQNPKVFQPKDSKRIVKHYNSLAKELIKYETEQFEAWKKITDLAKQGLRARLIVTHPQTGRLYVNFDPGVLQLMREAKHLQLMGFPIPNSAKIVLLLEDKLKSYYNEISHALSVYNRVMGLVSPVTRGLLAPHFKDIEKSIRPACTTMTWTSMNIEQFLASLRGVLSRFENLINQINDIMDNRIQKNLEFVSSMVLLDLPQNQSFNLRDFISVQRAHIDKCTEQLLAKNVEIERSVDDLIESVTAYPLDPSIQKPGIGDIAYVKLHYSLLMYNALLSATKNSLTALKKRVSAGNLIASDSALFDVDMSLQLPPNLLLTPSLHEIQDAVNAVARDVLSCNKKILDWGVDPAGGKVRASGRKPFYDKLSTDKNVALVLLLLTGAMEETRTAAQTHMAKIDEKYNWLWKDDPEKSYIEFVKDKNRILDDFVSKLHNFVELENEINELPSVESIGSLNLKSDHLKADLKREVDRWKLQYAEKLHQEAKRDMDSLTDLMTDLKTKLERRVKDFASLKFVMDAQAEIREVQSWIDAKFDSIIDRYNMLEKYLPFGLLTKDEMDAKSVLRTQWATILSMSSQVMDQVNNVAPNFKESLLEDVKQFNFAVNKFRVEYDTNGPMTKSITPQEAITRLNKYKREFETLNRKYELYNGGEKLFGLTERKYPDLVRTKKELKLLDQLYTLYQEVISTVDEYKGIAWSEVLQNINEMNATITAFSDRCKHLPKTLKHWDAYVELNQLIEEFLEVLPLLKDLCKPSMRERHWRDISKLTGKEFDLDKFHELKLRSVLEANLLDHREDIEEITDAADKELTSEKKLIEISGHWDTRTFEFAQWKDRGEVILHGPSVTEIVEQLEESQASLVQMLTQRHIKPFKPQAEQWLKKLSDVNEALEQWIKVQMLWMSLEAVFTGGDIARQMPQDARVFLKVDKEWTTRLMNKAKEVKNVVDSCQNEYIKNMLPTMFLDLEKCQKALDGYLEAKRAKFPRFYFVSNPSLLTILSQGSDKEQVQDCFSKVFDSIDRVDFQGNNIIKIRSLMAGENTLDSEEIPLTKPVAAKGNIEEWLLVLQKEMGRTMKDKVRAGASDFENLQFGDFVDRYCAQVALLGIQLMWTNDVQEAIIRMRHEKNTLVNAFKKQTVVLGELTAMTISDIKTKMQRTKIETLVTIQVHQRDVLAGLVQRFKEKKLKDIADFEWQKQMRFYWVPEDDECVVRIADYESLYCYEYLGCKERLVVTPLTDRAYISLTQALGMHFGGAPAGPAGTGKTETVKDLGRALGKYIVVFNCSDQMHAHDTAKMYKGLCMSGSWGCFDEFNRIELEVLSVVAQQINAVLTALRSRADSFHFPGEDGAVNLDTRCGLFITMNPGYAGRVELPENLKALFRGVAMMLPDRGIIIAVKLASVGFVYFDTLAVKFRVLYNLCEEQLSKQRHYDFGLRNILSVLRTAGSNLRVELQKAPNANERHDLEERLMMRTLRDMNLSKLVADDVGLFMSLLHDLFPGQKDPEKRRYDKEEEEMRKVIEDMKLIHHESWVNKAIQLYETSLVRHGLMMVGPAGGGKSTAIKVLADALTAAGRKHVVVRMNPKAILPSEMFGESDVISGEWTHGVFSKIWSKYNDMKKQQHTWIVCDGPVDANWIENLNTVLDDNKLLTLANRDRVPMTDNVRLLFEVEDLRNASPATVSRAGIIFVSATDLGYEPLFLAWLKTRKDEERGPIGELYQKFIGTSNLLLWMTKNVRHVMPVTEMHLVTNFLHLLEGLLTQNDDVQKTHSKEALERLVLYSLCWSLGGCLEHEDRVKFSNFLCDLCESNLPPMENDETIYDFFVNEDSLEWARWQPPAWEYQPDRFNFSTALVPTVDSVRAEYLISSLLDKLHKPVLIVGSSGTAKTSIVLQYTNTFDASEMLLKKINFSSATTAGMFQASIEADIEKRQRNTFAPPGGRWMTVFLDDMSMPEVNIWGDQATLEIVRQLIEQGGFYFLEKDKRGSFMIIENMLYIGAMNHPGGGRNDIPNRLKRHFFTFNMTSPSQSAIDNIYGSMLSGRFEDAPNLLNQVNAVTGGVIDLWAKVRARMLPTPSKFHYIFNMRDLSRVFQGILHAPIDVLAKDSTLVQLWHHECNRVFSDKLTNMDDKKWYRDTVMKVMAARFGEHVAQEIREQKETTYFVDFLRDEVVDPETDEVLEEAPKVYEPIRDLAELRARVDNFLTAYNEQSGVKPMNLVLFNDALEHVMRISRIIGMPRGSALMVGVGGSGRQSLTRLAAYIAKHDVFQIKLTRSYKLSEFKEDVKKLYVAVGKDGRKVTWIMTDFEIVDEDFLECVNAILSTGEVAGLFSKDERDIMCSELRNVAAASNPDFVDTPDNLYKFFLDRIRDNLHIVLCFSPANEKFADRARRFPAIISCCTIDWFLRWPKEALLDVSYKFLTEDKDFKVECDQKVERSLVNHIATVHKIVTEACEEYFNKYRRHVYVTPKSYLSFIKAYKLVYREKLDEIMQQQHNVENGLKKLKEAERDMDILKRVLEKQNEDLAKADAAATIMLDQLDHSVKEAAVKKSAADKIEEKCTKTANIINTQRAAANRELEQAMPFVRAAEKAAKSINKKDINIIQRLPNPPPLIKRIMDCVLILLQRQMDKVNMQELKSNKGENLTFVADSYDTFAKKVMSDPAFTKILLDFAVEQKDNITDETMELLEPYLELPDFTPERAKVVSSSAEGLCRWVRAMADYHNASKTVKPLLDNLERKSNLYNIAVAKLRAAQESSQRAQAEVDSLQQQFASTMAEKTRLETQAKETQEKMQAANSLIRSLAGEKKRWNADMLTFLQQKDRLVGDVALACAFVSYLGPFNHEFRNKLLHDYFYKDCYSNGIPVTKDLDLNAFLVDPGTIAEWNSQGLPKDDLSIQNGILVTQASRYPLLIDPQGQALAWLKSREAGTLPAWGTTTLSNPALRDQLEYCMSEGKPLIIESLVKDVDPMLDPVLEKNIMYKGRNFKILMGEKEVTIDPNFRLYLITKIANPKFSPELSAKTTIIDFSVTMKGLEDQLLSRVIQFEQKSLEDQRQKLIDEVNMNTISLQSLDKQLLERLSASQKNLLDDAKLIGVLADTKAKAQEVKEKIEAAQQTEQIINKKREQYRPVAARGSVIYFVIVGMAQVNNMYQTSLAQYLTWFDISCLEAEKANLVANRVSLLKKHLTFVAYSNINRGLFEKDKLTFKLMIALSVLQSEEDNLLKGDMVNMLLRAGTNLTPDQIPRKPFDWLQASAWANVNALNSGLDFFTGLRSLLEQHEPEWRKWYESEAPEELPVPKLQESIDNDPAGSFYKFLVVRCFREDRTRLAANQFIGDVLGARFNDPQPVSYEDIVKGTDSRTPIVLLLTPGADPTSQLEDLAKKRGVKIYGVSMGQGQEPHARKCVASGMDDGGWALLQNCHLGLGYMAGLDEEIYKAHEQRNVDPNFRLWITCEPHEDFPINLLQMSVKLTGEPPRGMKAGLMRSYTSVVDQERLVSVESKEWRDMVFALCFMHSAVQERRKFGPVGWCIPYEFNSSDLEASLTFLEKTLSVTNNQQGLSWPTIQYMICEVQYGGRVTDDYDRVLLNTIGKLWLSPALFVGDFNFAPGYRAFPYIIPQTDNIEAYRKYINDVPGSDHPEVFGLHGNAEITFGTSEAQYILNTIADTQPKEREAGKGGVERTKEQIVEEQADTLLKVLPKGYKEDEVREYIRKRPAKENDYVLGESRSAEQKVDGFTIPLNVFLYQEIARLNNVIKKVRNTLQDLKLAINGEISMTPELQDALTSVYDNKPPKHWYKAPDGEEIAWTVQSLTLWINGLIDREKQLSSWLTTQRPMSFWLTGFFNPQGFLTACRQEVTRRHKADKEKWALDDVVLVTEVTDHVDLRRIRHAPEDNKGVLIYGLFLEGAAWDRKEKMLVESAPRELYTPMPVLLVTPETSAKANRIYDSKDGSVSFYDCPVYTKPARKRPNYVFQIKLRTAHSPAHWTMRGVAMLCSKEG